MHIGILHIGFSNTAVAARHQPAPVRFQNLLNPFINSVTWQIINCLEDPVPTNLEDFDTFLITGGKYSVFEATQWQDGLFAFIRKLFTKGIPVVGICYGHQAIAYALGGEVSRSSTGWGVGLMQVGVSQSKAWMHNPPMSLRLLSMHQDQVTKLPANADVFLASDFCPYSGYVIGDLVFAVQQHPEFTPELCQDLIERRKERIGDCFQAAIHSLKQPHEGPIIGQWIANFLQQNA